MNQVPQTFNFDRHFQQQILALMLQDTDFLIVAQDIIKPEFFSDKVLIWYFTTIRNYYLDYQMRMSLDILKNELLKAVQQGKIRKEDDIKAYAECHKQVIQEVPSKEYITKELVAFCKSQAIKSSVMEMPGLLIARDFESIESNFRKAMDVGEDFGAIGTNYFVNWTDRLKSRAQRYESKIMPTGITVLDIYLGGGLRPKQLGIWMAPTNRGKSIALCHCGKRAVIMGKKVLHYTMELSEEDVAERYDSSFSKISMSSLFDEEAALVAQLEKLGMRWGNALIIKEYPAGKPTLAMMSAHFNQCVRSGFVPDMILIDYLDLMRPTHRRLQKREELSDLTTETRGWAMELGLPIWSATQSQRIAISMETHTEEQVGEDIGKVNIADVVITINQTREEVMQNKMRLFLAKNRNGRKYIEVPIITDLDRMCFYVPNGLSEGGIITKPGRQKVGKPTGNITRKAAVKKAVGKSTPA